MTLTQTIQRLLWERVQIDKAIAALEVLGEQPDRVKPRSKRGRQSMGKAERLVVAERMRKYWAEKRKERMA